MARRNRNASRRPESSADWLGRDHAARQRPWALEEQLLGPRSPREGDWQRYALAERLSEERIALSQIEAELREQMRRVSELEEQLTTGDGLRSPRAASMPESRPSRRMLTLRATSPPPDRDYWLSRCEGFLVESPTGRCLGVVEGLRFDLRIDRPDLLEVEIGRLRRKSLLLPVDEVEYISGDEERIVLSHEPLPHRDLAHELLTRVRGKLHVSAS